MYHNLDALKPTRSAKIGAMPAVEGKPHDQVPPPVIAGVLGASAGSLEGGEQRQQGAVSTSIMPRFLLMKGAPPKPTT